jgi:hypothetical protein
MKMMKKVNFKNFNGVLNIQSQIFNPVYQSLQKTNELQV